MIVFPCQSCRTPLSAEPSQIGMLVRCPTCRNTLRVPNMDAAASPAAGPTAAEGPALSPNPSFVSPQLGRGQVGVRRYGFDCAYCSSRLEASENMAGQQGQCPTCGKNIVIPILDRQGRLIDPITMQIIKPDPHPVHAYAAAGDRAPKIIRREDGSQWIQCVRCQAVSPVSANNCKSCGMPFTMEGTTLEAAGVTNGFCTASLVLGVIGLFTFCAVIPPVLALIFGIIGLNQVAQHGQGRGKGMAITGIILGAIGSFFAFALHSGLIR